ncbi:MAG TPA: OB-fold domain-containing protein [Solirubrobacteraceae bacterium]|nr:OB-fold domain-containing protein [Solirubrobacteraceae bacterium]
MDAVAAHPGLYDPAVSEPRLRGDRCTACSAAAFPPLRWGCQRCGAPAEQLVEDEFETTGKLLAFATVHRLPRGEVPYTIGEILLDAGPVVRARMASADGSGLRFDARVRGRLVSVGRDEESGAELVDLRFDQTEES